MESFNIVKRGYDPKEVDEYIETLEQVIKSYKEKDNAIKNAIISAQMAADNILKNSQAEIILRKNQAFAQLREIYESLDIQRSRVQAFQDDYNNLIRQYLSPPDDASIALIFTRIDELENLLREISTDMEAEGQ